MDRKPISVSALNLYIKSLMGDDPNLSDVLVSGEISGFKHHLATGHLYFDLKDAASLIRVVMFAGNVKNLRFTPKDGMKVIIKGRVGVFERGGSYQVYASSMEPEGIGSLYMQFLELKERLTKEGLFDPSKKRRPKKMPENIAVITSKTGAVIKDIQNVLSRRYPLCKIILFPSSVQGTEAADEIVKAFELVNETDGIDTVILARGGGSQNDLWCFNEEKVVRAIRSCRYPVISAVGHETDFTLSDFAADLRAPTPSAAAELAASDIKDIKDYIAVAGDRMRHSLEKKLVDGEKRLSAALSYPLFKNPEEYFDEKAASLLYLSERITRGFNFSHSRYNDKIEALIGRIESSVKVNVDKKSMALSRTVAEIEAMNPLKVLLRGYAAVSKDETVISSVKTISVGDDIKVLMSDGTLKTKVLEMKENGK